MFKFELIIINLYIEFNWNKLVYAVRIEIIIITSEFGFVFILSEAPFRFQVNILLRFASFAMVIHPHIYSICIKAVR